MKDPILFKTSTKPISWAYITCLMKLYPWILLANIRRWGIHLSQIMKWFVLASGECVALVVLLCVSLENQTHACISRILSRVCNRTIEAYRNLCEKDWDLLGIRFAAHA
jgi:uncharacterized membrane protein YhdT